MKTLEEIDQIRTTKRAELDLRVNENAQTGEKHILVCGGTGCTSSKSPVIIENLRKAIKENNLEDKVKVIQTGCFGLCAKGNDWKNRWKYSAWLSECRYRGLSWRLLWLE